MISRPLSRVDPAAIRALAVACGLALLLGVLVAATTPLLVGGALFGVSVVALVWWRPWTGVILFLAVVALLPFGVIPVSIGAQLTFIDAILIATFSAVLGRVVLGGRQLPIGITAAALLGFVLVMIVAFVNGTALSAVQPELVRRVAKLIASLLFFIVACSLLTTASRVEQLVRWLMLAGGIQGAIGSVLMAFSPATQLNVLSSLRVLGYPTTDILRFVPGPNNAYTDQLRAIGTSVDPNVFGGTLMLALAVMVVQLVAPRPVLPRVVLLLLAVPTSAGILLSLSRASWVGLACGLLLIGVLCYRRLIVLAVLVGVALLATPVGQDVVERFVSGLSTADRATAFRLGEYGNALLLIQRYPLFGIGFGVSPDIDVTAGVSSVYLLVAEQTGLLGLLVYLVALLTLWWSAFQTLRLPVLDDHRRGVLAALLAALSSALVAGLLDHYFANYAFPHAVALFWLYAGALWKSAQV